jgi:hypothetical protein
VIPASILQHDGRHRDEVGKAKLSANIAICTITRYMWKKIAIGHKLMTSTHMELDNRITIHTFRDNICSRVVILFFGLYILPVPMRQSNATPQMLLYILKLSL